MSMFSIIIQIIIAIVFVVVISGILTKKAQRKIARSVFGGPGGTEPVVLQPANQATGVISYLKQLLETGQTSNVILECRSANKDCYLQFDGETKNIKLLINPKTNQPPLEVAYTNWTQVRLHHETYTRSTGSGKNRKTYHYNHYYVYLEGPHRVEVFNKRITVSSDKGLIESQARIIGELTAKLLECNLQRINGERAAYTELDVSIVDKLEEHEKKTIPLKKQYFTVVDLSGGFCINKLIFFNAGLIVCAILGAIASVALAFFIRIKSFHFSEYLVSLDMPLLANNAGSLLLTAVILFCLLPVLLIILSIKFGQYQRPKEKPLVLIFSDHILIKPIYKNGTMTGGEKIDLSLVEEIEVREEKSRGYSVRIISDEVIKNAASFSDIDRARWIKEEILDCIYKIQNNSFY